MTVEVETRSRARFFTSMRRFLSPSDPERPANVVALVSTIPAPSVNAMFQDARNTSIRQATFNIYASGPPMTALPSLESTNPPQSAIEPSITELPVLTNLMALSAGSILPAGPILTPQTSPEIYVHHLITKNRGYPLWIPSPNMRLPASYRATGVRIGDVGIITPEGGFSFLFNVFHESTHPINASMRLPEDFVPFTRDTQLSLCDVDEFKESSGGSYLGDESLVRMDEGDNRFKTILKTSAAHAAVLMTPEPVYASKLQSTVLLRKYVRNRIKGWYRFVQTVLGREVDNGDLRVVYGCRKSVAFGIATVSNLTHHNGTGSIADGSSTELTFSIDDSWMEATGCKYRWHHRGSAEVKAGPSLDENWDIQQEQEITRGGNLQANPVINQCLFVSTIDFTFSEDEWQQIGHGDTESVATSQSLSPPLASEDSSSMQSTFSGGRQLNSSHSPSPGSGQNEGLGTFPSQDTYILALHDSLNWPTISPAKRLFHPSDIVAQFLLRMIPHATSVAVCSDDWGPYMTDSVQTIATLIDHVLSANDICEDSGMIYLSPKGCVPFTDFSELANPLAITEFLVEWCRQNNLWPLSLEFNDEHTYLALRGSVQEVVDLNIHQGAPHNVRPALIDPATIAHLKTVPEFGAAVALIKSTAAALENMKVHKQQCAQMCGRCLSLMVAFKDGSDGPERIKVVEIADEIEMIVQRIDRKLREWSSMSHLRSFLTQREIMDGIDRLNRDIDGVNMRFNFRMLMEIAPVQLQTKANQERDKSDLRELLQQIIENPDDMKMLQNMSRDWQSVEEIMESLQTELMDPSLDSIKEQVFKAGLWELHEKTAKLPPLTNLTGQVDIGPQVTKGTYSDIFSGCWLNKEIVALRLPRTFGNSPDDQRLFQQSVFLWRRLSHDNITPLYGFVYQSNSLYTVSPWMENGSVSDYIKKNPTVDRLKLLNDAAMGLEYLHQEHIVHGAVKGNNLMISKNGTAQLSDFGFSKFWEDCGKGTGITNPIIPRWCAPEILQQTGPLSTYSDVWSFGMLCLEVLSGQPPYAKFNREVAVLREVNNGRPPDHPGRVATQNGLSDQMWKLMQKCWSLRPEHRPSITEVKNTLLAIRGFMNLPQEIDLLEGSQPTPSKVFGIFSKSSRRPNTTDSPKRGASSLSSTRPIGAFLSDISEDNILELAIDISTHSISTASSNPSAYQNDRHNSLPSVSTPAIHLDHQSPTPSSAMSVASSSSMDTASNRGTLSISHYSSPPTSLGSHFPGSQGSTESDDGKALRAAFLNSSHLSGPAWEAVTDPRTIVNLNETGMVSSGTLEGFVEHLITQFPSRKEAEFRDVLLTACADFTTPEDLFAALSRRFFQVEADQTQHPEDRVALQYNIFSVIMYWLSNRNLPVDQQLLWQMKSFCEMSIRMKRSATMHEKAGDLLDLIETRRYKDTSTPPVFPGRVKLSASQILPSHLAIALALLEGDKYKALVPADYIAHLRRHPGYNNLEALYTTNNKIAYWVKDSILHYEKVEQRTDVLKFFIHTANECLKIRNFSSLMAIASALNSAPIDRLKITKAGLKPELKNKLKFIESIIDPSSNYREYHSALNNTATPQERDQCIPWLAIHLKELHHVLQRFPATVEVRGLKLINFERYVKFMDRVREVAHYKPPDLEQYRSAGYLDYLERQLQSARITPESDDQMMTRSRMIEGEAMEDRTQKPLLRTLNFRG